jgi:mono/diheme cytochrome c family protein
MPLRYIVLPTVGAFVFSLLLVFRIMDTQAVPVAAGQPKANAAGSVTPQLIANPSDPPEMAEAPGRDVFMANCLNCHSARYVTMQPRFSRSVWKAEVAKMTSAYKAPIAAPQQNEIVDYLVAAYGTPDKP